MYLKIECIKKYLMKYRLPKAFSELRERVNRVEDKVDCLVIKRNLAISFDRSNADIDAITDQIVEIREKEMREPWEGF